MTAPRETFIDWASSAPRTQQERQDAYRAAVKVYFAPWPNRDRPASLSAYLGLTPYEGVIWNGCPARLDEIIEARRTGVPCDPTYRCGKCLAEHKFSTIYDEAVNLFCTTCRDGDMFDVMDGSWPEPDDYYARMRRDQNREPLPHDVAEAIQEIRDWKVR